MATETTLSDLFAVNGQDDEREPWCAADDSCETIEIRGEDLIVLCEDGVARWTNTDREWTEVTAHDLRRVAGEIYRSGHGGNTEEAAKFLGWMEGFWSIPAGLLAEITA